MATPMDLDTPDSASSANGTPSTSLNVTRTLGNNFSSTSPVTDVIASFRPTKVAMRPSPRRTRDGWPRYTLRQHVSTAASVQINADIHRSSPSPSISPTLHAVSTRRDTVSSIAVTPRNSGGMLAYEDQVNITDSDNPEQLFKRDDIKDGRPQPHILSLDYDDPGELLMTSESDETIQIYKVRDGKHEKSLLSKKYGVKHAKFTHTSTSIVYASTKVNDAIRYLTTHDNSFLRYFEGHEAAVTNLAMHPGHDDFISCSKDNTVRLWNAGTKNATGIMYLNNPCLAAWDPSGQCFAIGSPACGQVLIYDHRNFDKPPFAVFDIIAECAFADATYVNRGWTKLEFSNDGKNILLGTKGGGHFLIDAFQGTLRAYLHKPEKTSTGRLAAGEDDSVNGGYSSTAGSSFESSGDCCFTPDGRYVIGGSKNKVFTWDTLGQVDEDKTLEPLYTVDSERPAAVVASNPRFNFFATADKDLILWVPDPHA